MTIPQLPPLFTGQAAAGRDTFKVACSEAAKGCDAGRVIYDISPETLRVAIIFAPEVALSKAAAILPICGVGLQNAMGALAPPEVAVHLGWDGGIYVNGGRCGALRMAAPGNVDAEPDWLVIDLTLALWPKTQDTGLTPDETALYAEGCADVNPITLIEAWVRHTLVGINSWEDGGLAALHREWAGLAHGLEGKMSVAGHTGSYIGLDEDFGLLLKVKEETVLIPLTANIGMPA